MSGLTTRNLFKSDSLNDVLDKYQLSPKRFLKVDKFYKVLKCSFKFKTIKEVKDIIAKWNRILKRECRDAKLLQFATHVEIQEAQQLNYREIVKIINIGKILNMNPEINLVLSMLIVYSTFVFEQTGIYLTLNDVYDIFSNKVKIKYRQYEFISDYFIKGTSENIQKVLYDKNI